MVALASLMEVFSAKKNEPQVGVRVKKGRNWLPFFQSYNAAKAFS